jgi:hypothetical protein
MASQQELRKISEARLQTVAILISAKDWEGAGYMMGWVLECALKSVICKTLTLTEYPRSGGDDAWFHTHRLARLLRLSGMENVFGTTGGSGFYVWSQFVEYYEGEWPSMRYDTGYLGKFTEETVLRLYEHLASAKVDEEGIITIINRENRW